MCAAVEAELDSGQLGEAMLDWMRASLLAGRVLMMTVIRPSRRTPSERARTAVELLTLRDMLQHVQELFPTGSWELLGNTALVPEPLRRLIESWHRLRNGT